MGHPHAYRSQSTEHTVLELWLVNLFETTGIWKTIINTNFDDRNLMSFEISKALRCDFHYRQARFEMEEFFRTGRLATFFAYCYNSIDRNRWTLIEPLRNDPTFGDLYKQLISVEDEADWGKVSIRPKDCEALFRKVVGKKLTTLENFEPQRGWGQGAGTYWRTLGGVGQPPSIKKTLAKYRKRCGTTLTENLKHFAPHVVQNLAALRKTFGWSEVETGVFAFLFFVEQNESFRSILNLWDYQGKGLGLVAEVVADGIGVTREAVSEALSFSSALVKSGMIDVNPQAGSDIEDVCRLHPSVSWGKIQQQAVSTDELLHDLLAPVPEASLTLDDYEHLPLVRSVVVPYLRAAIAEKKTGVNILLYGLPGTGKTELTRTVAELLEAEIYEVDVEHPEHRLLSWRTGCTYLAKHPRTILVLDEAEDVFGSTYSDLVVANHDNQTASIRRNGNKGQINRWLETNPIPTFWISNKIQQIDPAMIRRFDIVLEVKAPSEEGRKRMIRKLLGSDLSDAALDRLARTTFLAPAVLKRAADVTQAAQAASSSETLRLSNPDNGISDARSADAPSVGGFPEDTFLSLVSETLRGQRFPDLPDHASSIPDLYDPSFLPASIDPDSLLEGLRRYGSGRLCFYGPPGTGKSAFAVWLAKSLGRPIHRRTYGELSSCYLGETEKNIAEAFREAERDKAVLVIDEADSFFRDRSMSVRSWETTIVNEILAQLENFEGIFIATTNLMRDFDEASLRRFDWKLEFTYLDLDGRSRLAERHLAQHGFEMDEPARRLLSGLDQLTPGDFAAVARQVRFRPLRSAVDFVERLAAEEDAKRRSGPKATIGFS